jgi:hypothetical protein
MNPKRTATINRVFSLDLKSKNSVRSASFGNGKGDRVTIEGTIGALEHAEFVDDAVLELAGTKGVLRVDLSREDLARPLQKDKDGLGK